MRREARQLTRMACMRSVLFAVLLVALAACGATAQPAATPEPGAEGRRLFAIWCSGCHAVEAGAPDSIGPNLAGVAARAAANPDGLTADSWLRRETLDPNAVITPGYQPGLMPATYGGGLSEAEVDALVVYMLTLE
jgi:mono/diheme cytochrome c family protein